MVQSRVEDLSPVVKKVSVEVTPDRVKDALDRAFTSVSRTVKLKGYRQGHVPRRLVERYFGDDVKKDVAQKLVTIESFRAKMASGATSDDQNAPSPLLVP